MNNPTIQAAIIAGTVALVVAVISQVVSVINQILTHRLTIRRENQKYYNEVYQKFYAPIISDVFLYMDMMSNFRRGHDYPPGSEEETLTKILDFVNKNIVYASPTLLSRYHEMISLQFKDERGFYPNEHNIAVLLAFVNEYDHTIKQSSIYNGRPKYIETDAIVRYRVMYLFWYLLSERIGCLEANEVLSYSFLFDQNLDVRAYKRLHWLLHTNALNSYSNRALFLTRVLPIVIKTKKNTHTIMGFFNDFISRDIIVESEL